MARQPCSHVGAFRDRRKAVDLLGNQHAQRGLGQPGFPGRADDPPSIEWHQDETAVSASQREPGAEHAADVGDGG
jgi:hypothetical protein